MAETKTKSGRQFRVEQELVEVLAAAPGRAKARRSPRKLRVEQELVALSSSSNRISGSNKQKATDVVRSAVRELRGSSAARSSRDRHREDGSEWRVTVEVVELERIPNTTDVLGVYEVTVDKNGDLTGTRRTRRFYRSEAGED